MCSVGGAQVLIVLRWCCFIILYISDVMVLKVKRNISCFVVEC